MALWLKLAPLPICDTHLAFMMSRTIMVATKVGVFEELADQGRTAAQVAERCSTDVQATKTLLDTLVHLSYLQLNKQLYQLSPLARKWMLKDSPASLHDKMLLQFLEWNFVEHYETYLRTGEPLEYHRHMDESQWQLYQRGMRSVAGISVEEIAARTPVPPEANDMLDIGGAHGHYSVALCRKYPQLRSIILELPEAIQHAEPILADEQMGDRVTYRAGDVLTSDLGEAAWDIIFVSSLAHHLDRDANQDLAKRAFRALRPGGFYIVQDFIKISQPKAGDHLGGLFNLYFAATSQSGIYSESDVSDWLRAAGFEAHRTLWLRTIPRHAQVVGKKPR